MSGTQLNLSNTSKDTLLSLVIPVFNEAETIEFFMSEVNRVFSEIPNIQLEFVFINDGSTDVTLDNLLQLQKHDVRIKVADLSRNFGKEAAMTAGLNLSKGDIIVPIDVDLQDPPELILDMIAKWKEGYEVVVGRRINRDSDSIAKRVSANWFYRIHNAISDYELPENVGDFRLMDKKVVDALKELPESRRFMKGLFSWLGFRTAYIDYTRPKRIAGSTKFHSWKLWNFALEGITGFSTAPLHIWTYIGLFVSLISFVYAIFIAARVIVQGIDVPGYASLMVAIIFIGGLQLIGIGIIGEYLGRTYMESKRRPIFLIRHIYGDDSN